jgi:hypothetical protein
MVPFVHVWDETTAEVKKLIDQGEMSEKDPNRNSDDASSR